MSAASCWAFSFTLLLGAVLVLPYTVYAQRRAVLSQTLRLQPYVLPRNGLSEYTNARNTSLASHALSKMSLLDRIVFLSETEENSEALSIIYE